METLVLVVRPAPQEVTSYLCYSCNFLCGRKEAELRSFFPYTKNYIHEVPDYLLLLQEEAELRSLLLAATNILVLTVNAKLGSTRPGISSMNYYFTGNWY